MQKENFNWVHFHYHQKRKSRKLRVPKKLGLRKHTQRHIIITLPTIKDKQRILKAARGKETVTYKGVPIRLSADSSK